MNLRFLLFAPFQCKKRKILSTSLFLLFFFHIQHPRNLGLRLRKQSCIRNLRANVGLYTHPHRPLHL